MARKMKLIVAWIYVVLVGGALLFLVVAGIVSGIIELWQREPEALISLGEGLGGCIILLGGGWLFIRAVDTIDASKQ